VTSAISLPIRLEQLVGSDRVVASESAVKAFAIAGRAPMAVLKPRSAEEIAEIVSFAAVEKLALLACGSRSKLELGMPPRHYDLAVDMTALRGIAHYDPGDLTVSVDAGMPLHELAKTLAAQKQFLPLAVPCSRTSTAGGAIASGIDSTLRQQYGTARDFLIGAEFVDGTGKQCKSGGRVVKNVTGYDLHKLLVGSLGTLGVISRLNFRTFPLPELCGAHLAVLPTLETALNFHASLLNSGLPFSNLELFDSGFSALLSSHLKTIGEDIPESVRATGWHVFASFEGSEAVLQRITRELQKLADRAQAERSETLDLQHSHFVNEGLREAFDWLRRAAPGLSILRIVLPGVKSVDLKQILDLSEPSPLRASFLLRACNVAYLAVLAANDNAQSIAILERGISALFSRVETRNGSAALLDAPPWLKERINVWGRQRPDFPLMQRVKQAFDPQNIFSPGRFVGGI
jgi:glycolate oxidase FAD binding subunit